jgi:hypothetical protein
MTHQISHLIQKKTIQSQAQYPNCIYHDPMREKHISKAPRPNRSFVIFSLPKKSLHSSPSHIIILLKSCSVSDHAYKQRQPKSNLFNLIKRLFMFSLVIYLASNRKTLNKSHTKFLRAFIRK